MANPDRKIAMVKRIDKITPIENADRLELAHVGGWQSVVVKGDFEPRDLCVFVEPDAFLPADDERYESFARRGTKEMTINDKVVVGHVLRTSRLRGVWSQGVCFKPEEVMPSGIPHRRYAEMCDEKIDVGSLINVCEYVSGIPMSADFVGKYDNFVAPRTDAERVQNVDTGTFDMLKKADYYTSVKVDGTSITLVVDPRDDEFKIFSHNNQFNLERGIGKVAYETAKRQGLDIFCAENPGVTLQAELCGPKIGGNRLRLKDYRLFVFSMWDITSKRYLNPYDTYNHFVSESLTPLLDWLDLDDYELPDNLLDWVDDLRGCVTKDALDEGIVVHVMGQGFLSDHDWFELCNALGPTHQMKAVSRKYLAKEK